MGSYTTFRIGQDKPSITRHTCIIEQNTNERLNVIKEVINNSGIHLIDTLFIDGDRGWVKELGLSLIHIYTEIIGIGREVCGIEYKNGV